MFCRKCGKALLEGDRFCCYCGAQVIERRDSIADKNGSEDVIFRGNVLEPALKSELPKVDVGAPEKSIAEAWQELEEASKKKEREVAFEPKWDVSGIPKYDAEPKKPKAIVVDWGKGEIIDREEAEENGQGELSEIESEQETLVEHGALKKEEAQEDPKEEEPKVEDTQTEKVEKETLIFSREEMNKLSEEQVSGLEKEILRDIQNKKDSVSSEVENQIDRFYTFSQKNAEFQKLLDREYERLEAQDNSALRTEQQELIEETDVISNKDAEISEDVNEASQIKEERAEVGKFLKEDSAVEEKSESFGKHSLDEVREFFGEEIEESEAKEAAEAEKEDSEKDVYPLGWEQQAPPLSEENKGGGDGLAFTIGGIFILACVGIGLVAMGICSFFPGSKAAAFIMGSGDMIQSWLNGLIK